MSPSRIGFAEARLRPLGLGGSNLLSSFSMRCQRSSGKAQSVKMRALSAIGLFVLRLINQEDKSELGFWPWLWSALLPALFKKIHNGDWCHLLHCGG